MHRRVAQNHISWAMILLAAAASELPAQTVRKKPQNAARAKQTAAGSRRAGSAVSEQECRAYADAVVKAVGSGNLPAFNALIDWDELFKTALAGMTMNDAQRTQLMQELKNGLNNETGISGQIVKNSKNGGELGFLRTRQNHGRQVILFRMIQPATQGGVGYFQFVPHRSADGQVRATDFYVYLSAEFISATLKRALLPVVANLSRGFLEKLVGGEQDYIRDLPKLENIAKLSNEGKMAEALAELKSLRPQTKKEKSVLMARLRAAQASNMQEYAAVLDDFRKLYPDDPCINLLLIDYHTLRKEFPKALASVDGLDQAVGGDQYLNVLRAGISEASGDLEGARKAARKAIAEEPTLVQPYYAIIGLSLKDQKYDETLEMLKLLDQKFHLKFNDLATVPDYAGFVQSPQHQKWLNYLAQKAEPASKTARSARKNAQ
jgi:tetratricopeptide (TPR) repeat protein